MTSPLDDQAQTRLALAALFAALAETLGERDESFPSRFDNQIEKIYRQMEDYQSEPIQTLETLRWAHELIGNHS